MHKRIFSILVCFFTYLLVNACTSNVQTDNITQTVHQTIEVTGNVLQTMTATLTVTATALNYPPPSPGFAYPPGSTPIASPTVTLTETPFVKFTQVSPTLTDQQVSEKISACYPAEAGCGACAPKLNNSVHYIHSTTRMFINVPKDLYPKALFQYQTSVSGQAGFGYISNGGLPGYAFDGSPECWSTYVEFGGQGEVDLRIPSILEGVPDYFVRFIVD